MWQRLAKHCPLCSAALSRSLIEGRERAACAQCDFVLYENPACASAGVVLDPQRRVLLIRRALDPYRGFWALPAGYQELDEHPAQTAAREILEETGIEVEVEELFDLLFIPAHTRRPANLAVFVCKPIGGILKPGHDALEAAWFALDELPSDLGFDNGPRILERIRKR